ncbi:MAG: hypothetical protein FWF47_02070 [Clostridia bacterium]|nr:hypothetical protein [Clostridia bacterium]
MTTKDEYYQQVLENRRLLADPQMTECPCPNPLCDWHGKCKECVALHRHYKDHIPVCLQPVISDKIAALAGVAELVTVKKEPTPTTYRQYVKEQDSDK